MTEEEFCAWDDVVAITERGWSFTLSYSVHEQTGWLAKFGSYPMSFEGKWRTIHAIKPTLVEALVEGCARVRELEAAFTRDTSLLEQEKQADAAEKIARDANTP